MRTRERARAFAAYIKELHEKDGMTASAVARYLGMDDSTIQSYIDGVSGAPKPRGKVDAQEVLRLASAGYSQYAICKTIGCSRHTVMTILANEAARRSNNK